MSPSADQIVADVAEVLYLEPADLDHQLDLRDQGMDSVRIMELADRWRQNGAGEVSFILLAEDRRLERWIELVGGPAREPEDPAQRFRTVMATVSLGGTLVEKLDAIAAAGFDGIELLDSDLRDAPVSAAQVAARCADLGLTIDLYQPFRRAEGVSDAEFPDVLERFRRELDVMAELGATSILVVSNTDDDADPSPDRSAEQLCALADTAAAHGMTVTYEALAWGTHIGRVAEARDVVRRAAHPALSLTVDTFHLASRGDGSDVLGGITADELGLIQVADAPWRSMDLVQWSRNHRCFPGEGEFDLAGPLAVLLAAGYRGPLSLEIFNPELRALPPHEVAARGAGALDTLVADLGGTTGAGAGAVRDPALRGSG
ncbi:TIM barrel protein [Pseudonocardia sp. NPDC049635]|uniref:TIM barrel protein n=1 Tax=Pseudonocardia sp. NPDC049635 TaxID=3155506 RepID=UPI0033D06E01